MYLFAAATVSADYRYRYSLTRVWGTGGSLCVFVLLNPSTADGTEDDPTVRRCVGFAKRLGCASLTIVNLFAFRATKPAALYPLRREDAIGPENDKHLAKARAQVEERGGHLIAGWGSHGDLWQRDQEVRGVLGAGLLRLGALTSKGQPRHPLYLPNSAEVAPL